jgi:hypothetical protein
MPPVSFIMDLPLKNRVLADWFRGMDGPNGIWPCQCRGRKNLQKGAPTMSVAMIGLDTAKSVVQIHAVNESRKVAVPSLELVIPALLIRTRRRNAARQST